MRTMERDFVVRSRALMQENRRILSQTRYRIAASRRRLNRAFAVAGSSDGDGLRAIVRAHLESGALFPADGRALAGWGSGKPCAVCGAPIGGAEVQYEVEKGVNGSVPAHLTCYMAWQEESKGWSPRPPRVSGALLATLRETHNDHIILNDYSRIFLTPKVRCTHPVGTRLQIVYTESQGKKIALSIERHLLS